MKFPRLALLAAGVCIGLPLTPSWAHAQQGAASIRIQVVDRVTQHPIAGVELKLLGSPLSTATDSSGNAEFTGLASGGYAIQAHAIGYGAGSSVIEVRTGEVGKVRLELQPVSVKLTPVVVEGKRDKESARFADFERRREHKMGTFVTREDIERRDARSLADLLQSVGGIREVCTGVYDCRVSMARTPTCLPVYFVDGRESSVFPAGTTPTRDIYGIEIYYGPAQTPAEFLGSTSGCGVIAIWTKSSP
jgi:CarboxypepD_reg-like domain/TonB-dependent Receptor Plug Domain